MSAAASGEPDVLSLEALGAFRDVEFDLLAFAQRAEPVRYDRGMMDKEVRTPFPRDERSGC